MHIKAQVSKWGNSLAVRIPKPLAEEVGLREGDEVEVSSKEGRVIINAVRKAPTLKELLAKVTSENIHEETEW